MSTSGDVSSEDDEEIDGDEAICAFICAAEERLTKGSWGDAAVALILILLRCLLTRLGRATTCGRETVTPPPLVLSTGWRIAAPVTCSERTPSPVALGRPRREAGWEAYPFWKEASEQPTSESQVHLAY